MKRTLSWLLICAVILSVIFTSCGEKETETTPSAPETEESAESVPEETGYDPGIEKADYNGYDFTVMERATDDSGWWYSMDVYAEGLTAEPVNDAVYARNETVNEYFNIKIKPYTTDHTNFKTELKNSAAANDHLVDIAMLTLESAISSSQDALLFDLNSFDVFNPDAPYYTQSVLRDTSVLNRNYLAVGDMTLVANEGTWAMMFNKQVAENHQVEDLYGLVRTGGWTIDKFYELTADIGVDDGNGKPDLKDFFGMLTTGDAYPAFLYAFDYKIIEKDENDVPVFQGMTERLTTAAEKLLQILDNDRVTCHGQLGGDWSDFQTMFESNQSLFYSEVLQCVTRLRNMDVDFGLLPLPKLDEIQDTYHTNIHTWASDALCIPTSCADPEMSASVFEYLSFASMSTLKPAYYDKTLTYKAMRDEESVEMLDYLLKGRVVDLGYISDIGTVYSGLMNQLRSGKSELSSFFQKKMKVADKQLDKFIENYEKIS